MPAGAAKVEPLKVVSRLGAKEACVPPETPCTRFIPSSTVGVMPDTGAAINLHPDTEDEVVR